MIFLQIHWYFGQKWWYFFLPIRWYFFKYCGVWGRYQVSLGNCCMDGTLEKQFNFNVSDMPILILVVQFQKSFMQILCITRVFCIKNLVPYPCLECMGHHSYSIAPPLQYGREDGLTNERPRTDHVI